jgi:hypothetical protein
MAEALDSPRRKAAFERANREDLEYFARRDLALTPSECLEVALKLNAVAFELAAAATASRAADARRS